MSSRNHRLVNYTDASLSSTQAVIILDEFDPVLESGEKAGAGKGNTDRTFSFLLTGMLPKLVKLNEAAERQPFVFRLATNYINSLDPAAVRPFHRTYPRP